MEPAVIILGAALLQWLVVVAISFFAARQVPKKLIATITIHCNSAAPRMIIAGSIADRPPLSACTR